jgi:hypothetical protein
MRGNILARLALCLSAFMLVTYLGARAQDGEPLPEVHVLPCTEKCASITRPVGINEPKPVYLEEDTGSPYGAYAEGYVQLQYTIGTDGHVSNIAVIHLMGSKKFADYTADAVKDWVYKPAMSDGQPVAVSHTLFSVFRIPNEPVGAQPKTVNLYREAQALAKDGKLDDSNARLNSAQALPRLNFYEHAMITNLMASIAMRQKDYRRARRLVDQITFYSGAGIPPSVIQELWNTRIISDVLLSNLGDAIGSLDHIRAMKWFDPANPVVKAVNDARLQADTMTAFQAEGEIPPPEDSDGFSFPLYRRAFSFRDISGSLDKFTMSCAERVIESPITDKAEWHVPKNWSNCQLLVRGTPGTTFQIVQYAE